MHPIIPSRWQVPEVFLKRLGEKSGRQRLMAQDGHLLLVLHKLPKAGEEEREPILFWRNPHGEWQSTEAGAGLADLQEYIQSYDRAADRLDQQLRLSPNSDGYFQVLREITPLLRATKYMATVMQQAREAAPNDRNLLLIRDETIETERHFELLHSEALHGLQYLVASQTERQAKQGEQLVASSHRLNLIMALCLPATALASVLGMNVHHGLENQETWVFWVVLVAAALFGLIILGLVARPVKGSGR